MAKTRVVSYSELDSYRQCRLKHQLGYVERWKPGEEAAALSRGRLFHEVLELHYRILMEAQQEGVRVTLDYIQERMDDSGLLYDLMTGDETEEQQLVRWIYEGYRDTYILDDDWKIAGVEVPLEAWLPTASGTRSSFRLKGKVDLVVRDMTAGGSLWIVDHKTCRNLPKQKDLDLEDQMALYIYLLRQQGHDIRGAIYNNCRTQKLKRAMTPDERFSRPLTVRTEKEVANVAVEVYETFLEAYRPRKGDAPRSPDSERCGWRCPFTEPCLAGRKGGDMRGMLEDTGFVQDFTRH